MPVRNKKKQDLSANQKARDLHPWIISLALTLLTFWVFSRVLGYPFINLDDEQYITQNPIMKLPFSWATFQWAFTAMGTGDWQPLVWLSYFADRFFFGFEPGGYHFTNLLLHTANVLLIFWIFFKVTGRIAAAAFLAAFFAVHPLRVESVAWVAERKDVLSGLFWWLTVGAYLAYQTRADKSQKYYYLAILSFTLAVMSKPMVVSLPLMLLLLDFWPLKRFDSKIDFRAVLAEKIPFVLLAVFSSMMTLEAHKVIGAIVPLKGVTFYERLSNAVVSYFMYLQKTIWPFGLSIFYPFPHPQAKAAGFVILAGTILGAVSFWVWKTRKERPYLFFGWVWYLVTLGPVIGLVHISDQAMADRYMYLPHIGLAVMAIWGFTDFMPKKKLNTAGGILGGAVLIFFACTAQEQLTHWRTPLALNEHSAKVVPGNYFALNGIAYHHLKAGNLDQSLEAYQEALKFRRTARSLSNVGSIYVKKGKYAEAELYFRDALKINPRSVFANHNLALIHRMRNENDSALKHMLVAARYERQSPRARRTLADFYLSMGESEKAEAIIQGLLPRHPRHGRVLFLHGKILQLRGDTEAAAEVFQKAAWGSPRSYRAVNRLSLLWMQEGKLNEAHEFLISIIQSEPGYFQAYLNLGNVLLSLGSYDEAISWMYSALSLVPDSDAAKKLLQSAQKAKAAQDAGNPVSAMFGTAKIGPGLEVSTPQELRNLIQILSPTTSREFKG